MCTCVVCKLDLYSYIIVLCPLTSTTHMDVLMIIICNNQVALHKHAGCESFFKHKTAE